jgi:hypothetical protein
VPGKTTTDREFIHSDLPELAIRESLLRTQRRLQRTWKPDGFERDPGYVADVATGTQPVSFVTANDITGWPH